MKYTFLAISLKLILVKMILNQQRRVSNENSENSALLFENRRLDTSIVAILLFSSVSYEQRLLVILSSCNWMHRKHTKTRDRPVWTVWKHLSSWCIVCDCYLSRNIRSSDSFFLSDFLGKSGKLFEKKNPPLVSFVCRKAFISWCIEK